MNALLPIETESGADSHTRAALVPSLLDLRPVGGFQLIHSDPPWRWQPWSDKGLSRSPERHYATMDLAWIKALPVGELAARDCVLWLWASAPRIDQALEVVSAWGFRFSTSGVWVKTTKAGKPAMGAGHRLRNAHEPFLIGTRGSPRVLDRGLLSVIMARRLRHSEKPEEGYQMAARMVGPEAPKFDMFCRRTRPGWTPFGDQSALFDGDGN